MNKLVRYMAIVIILFGLICSSIGIGLLDQTSVQARSVKAGTFDSSKWQYRQSCAIKGSPDGNLSSYQMKLIVHKGNGASEGCDVYLNGHCKDDFSDLLFAKADGATFLDYWIENYSSGTSATVWVEFDSIPVSSSSASFYVYYGNANATSASNGSNTFIAFNDFSTALGWDRYPYGIAAESGINSAGWTLSNGMLQHTEQISNRHERAVKTIPNTNVRIHAKVNLLTSAAYEAPGLVGRYKQSSGSSKYYLARIQYYNGNPNDLKLLYENGAGGETDIGAYSFSPAANTWYTLELKMAGSSIVVSLDGTDRISVTDTNVSSGLELGIHGEYSVNSMQQYDDFFVANFTTHEPTWGMWGSEEDGPWGSSKLTGVQIGLLSFGSVLMLLGIILLFKRQSRVVVSGATAVVEKVKLMPMRTKGIIILVVGAIVVIIAVVMIFV